LGAAMRRRTLIEGIAALAAAAPLAARPTGEHVHFTPEHDHASCG